jgi:hypothetical protein
VLGWFFYERLRNGAPSFEKRNVQNCVDSWQKTGWQTRIDSHHAPCFLQRCAKGEQSCNIILRTRTRKRRAEVPLLSRVLCTLVLRGKPNRKVREAGVPK